MATEDRTMGRGENEDLALVPVGRAFRAMLKAFERDTGVSAPRWFVLSTSPQEVRRRGGSRAYGTPRKEAPKGSSRTDERFLWVR